MKLVSIILSSISEELKLCQVLKSKILNKRVDTVKLGQA